MYQKHHRNDELFTSASLSFALLLLTLFLIYEKVTNNLINDIDYYFYIVISVFIFTVFVYTTVFLLMNHNYRRLDIGIDFDRECVIIKNGKKTVPFSEIRLFGYNAKKKDVKLLVKGKLYGFLLENIVNEKNEPIKEEQILTLENYTKRVEHQHLYNFDLFIAVMMVISLYLYAFVNDDFRLLSHEVTTLDLAIAGIIVYLIVNQSNRIRYSQLLKEVTVSDDEIEVIDEPIISKEKSDTN